MGTDAADGEERLTLDEAAELLGVSSSTVRRMVRAGVLDNAAGPDRKRPVWRDDAERLRVEMSRCLTFEEAAAMAGLSHWTIRRLMAEGALTRTGFKVRPVSIDDLQAFLDSGGLADPVHEGRIPAAEAAAILGQSVDRVNTLANAGRLPGARDRLRRWWFRPGQLRLVVRAREAQRRRDLFEE